MTQNFGLNGTEIVIYGTNAVLSFYNVIIEIIQPGTTQIPFHVKAGGNVFVMVN